jgi:hypothetical protein
MRRVIVGAMVSMDGVMQAPGGPEEDQVRRRTEGAEAPRPQGARRENTGSIQCATRARRTSG